MKKTLVALSLAAMTLPALAQDKKAPEPDYTITGNFGLFSDYRFRGISQTDLKPALQGGFDYAHKSGFYLGTWGSNVGAYTSFDGAGLEIDFYGGYKFSLGDVGLDFGNLYYYYPGTSLNSGFASGYKANTNEIYVGVSYGAVTFKTSYATTRYFGTSVDTKGTLYYDLSAAYPLSDGWGFRAHIGLLKLGKKLAAAGNATSAFDSGVDYKVGITKDLNGFILALDYVGNSGDWGKSFEIYDTSSNSTNSRDLSKGAAVISLTKTF